MGLIAPPRGHNSAASDGVIGGTTGPHRPYRGQNSQTSYSPGVPGPP